MNTHMDPIKALDRKALVLKRVIQTIEEYQSAFNLPCPMKVLSAKYSRSLMELGGLPECLGELRKAGSIEVWLTRSGSKAVCTPNFPIQEVNAVKL